MMPRTRHIVATLPLLSCIVLLGAEAPEQAIAQQPIWSRTATVLDMSCSPAAPKLLSPDRHLTLDVRCDVRTTDSPYLLRVHAGKKQIAELAIPEGAHEIVWSPDSHAFLLNGGETAIAGFFVKAYTIDEHAGVHEHNVTASAQRDMVDAFPACKAAQHNDDCKRIESDPEFNMSGLGWTADSKAIFVFAEVPCSSSYGGIMCQARGYEIDVASGQILQRLSAEQAKRNWQAMAAWSINVPNPPVYALAATQ
jgi:hypothetical protein